MKRSLVAQEDAIRFKQEKLAARHARLQSTFSTLDADHSDVTDKLQLETLATNELNKQIAEQQRLLQARREKEKYMATDQDLE
jgi:hypothetical protein